MSLQLAEEGDHPRDIQVQKLQYILSRTSDPEFQKILKNIQDIVAHVQEDIQDLQKEIRLYRFEKQYKKLQEQYEKYERAQNIIIKALHNIRQMLEDPRLEIDDRQKLQSADIHLHQKYTICTTKMLKLQKELLQLEFILNNTP